MKVKQTTLDQLMELRQDCENNLFEFAKYINPHYVYGEIHEKVFSWLTQPDCKDHQLLLLPRGHLKSHCIGVWVIWELTRKPWSTVVYLSAGEDLASAQMYAIKNMLTSDEYQLLWPEMITPSEGKRDKWTSWSINLDHPERKKRGIRDNSIIIKTVKSNAIGLHCSHLVLDDVVVPRYAYSEVGRREVQQSVSQFASIKNPGAVTKAVGTRYHPKDLYSSLQEASKTIWDEEGSYIGKEKLWDIFEEKVENIGDMTGEYLWPRTICSNTGEWYGFDRNILSSIRAQYDSTGQMEQFYAQYYNDPNDPNSHRLDRSRFQYYEKKNLQEEAGRWYYDGKQLNVYAAMDVAWTINNTSDYTAIVVIGVDSDGYIYVLDIDRFKTSDFQVYYDRIIALAHYWSFRKMRIETNAGGKLVKQEVERLIRINGQVLAIDAKATTSHDSTKRERHAAIVEPRYRQQGIFHFKGGLTPELEEEIILERPRHDDLEDALCSCIEICKAPGVKHDGKTRGKSNVVIHTRFGGRRVTR